ncbi:MAG: FprA family A-type flavoprotein [Calditrichia bacterium]
MSARQIIENVYSVGAIDWHRTLFDALIPLASGTTYNAYFIRGSEKNALIDTVESDHFEELWANLQQLRVDRIDYIISNHAEQDHSGSLPLVLQKFPEAKIVTNKKCCDMLLELLPLKDDDFFIISDNETLSLGDKNLQFIFAPWVHWPETMFTYLAEDQVLFSCDLFGAHYASSRLFAEPAEVVLRETKRYYAEIMMPFARSITKYLDKLSGMSLQIIAPSHGPLWRESGRLLQEYGKWVAPQPENKVLIIYISMHGSTEKIVRHLTSALMQRQISVQPFNMVNADIGEIALELVDAATVVFASPAVLLGPHPNIVYAAYLINSLKPKTRQVGIIGSFGWGNKLADQLTEILSNLKSEFLSAILIKGYPAKEDLAALDSLAEQIHINHRGIAGV